MGRKSCRRLAASRAGIVARTCEALEPRMLLSVNITGTAGNDAISLSLGAGGVLHADVNGTTKDYTAAEYAGGITVDSKTGTDTLNVSALPAVSALIVDEERLTVNLGTAARGLQDIASTVLRIGDPALPVFQRITLNVNDAGDPVARQVKLDTATSGNPGDTYDVLHGLSAGEIWFSVWQVTSTTITTGTAADAIQVQSLGESGAPPHSQDTLPVTLVAGHTGTTVDVSWSFFQPLYVEGVTDSVTLSVNQSMNSDLTLRTAAQTLGNHPLGELDVTTGLIPTSVVFEADAMHRVMFDCSNNGNTIDVLGTPTDTVGGSAGPTIDLNTGTGDDHVTVRATGPGTILNVNGQNGTDTVTVGSSGSMQGVAGYVNVTNAQKHTNLLVDDSSDAVPRNVTLATFTLLGLTFGSVSGLAPGVINFTGANVSTVALRGGSGGNGFIIASLPQGTEVTLDTGAGNDQVTVGGTAQSTPLNIFGEGGDDAVMVDYTASGIADGSTVNVDGGPGPDTLTVHGTPGTTFGVIPGKITSTSGTSTATINYSNISTLVLDPATYNVNADLGAIALEVGDNADVFFKSSQHLRGLTIDAGGVASLTASVLPYSKVLATDSLVVSPGGRLDLENNELQLHYVLSPIASIRGLISSAYAGGTWGGPGITSKMADASHGIGYRDSADGLAPVLPSHTIVVRWSRYGDLNLDRMVGFADLLLLSQHYGQAKATWAQGDLNYDGKVDFSDLLRLAQNYGGGS